MSYIDEIYEKIENGELFVLCKETVKDDIGVYCIKGNKYEVVDFISSDNENIEYLIILIEDSDEMQIKIDDSDFEIIK